MNDPWETRGALPLRFRAKLGVSRLASVVTALMLSGAISVVAGAQQQAAAAPSLAFDEVTVVDVEHGRLIPAQRVVIVGNHIKAVGAVGAVEIPNGAQVVNGRGKYLIPGLWDMHTHSGRGADIVSYPLLIANGVTGIRDAGSALPLDTLRRWRREILAGTRVGPPRQLLSGVSINGLSFFRDGCDYAHLACISDPFDFVAYPLGGASPAEEARRMSPATPDSSQIAGARRLIDSLWAAGADMLKPRELGREMYFLIAAEARRRGIPLGGHAAFVSALEASDSGARIVDHLSWYHIHTQDLCGIRPPSVEQCRSAAERLRRNGTWLTNEMLDVGDSSFSQRMREFSGGSQLSGNWLRGPTRALTVYDSAQAKFMRLMQEVDMPILAASDWGTGTRSQWELGFLLHANLARYVVTGFTPLRALQTATLNPAKMLRATDSLGTVAPGKLADLVLLDADPLADITNTTAIRAVVANGRYFDRAALDALLAKVQVEIKQEP